MSNDSDYSPMTANEAGELRSPGVGGVPLRDQKEFVAMIRETCATCGKERYYHHDKPAEWFEGKSGLHAFCAKSAPSKPCTEGGEHCFCFRDAIQHSMMNHADFLCCHCETAKCFSYSRRRVPGHGPYRTELVREGDA